MTAEKLKASEAEIDFENSSERKRVPNSVRIRKSVRRASIVVFCGFALYLTGSVFVLSSQRQSILAPKPAFATQGVFSEIDAPTVASSKLELRDFRRVAVKDGKMAWEIKAANAEYYNREGVSHVNDASLTIFPRPEEKRGKVQLSAKSAKLYMANESLSRAELAGDTIVKFEPDMEMRSTLALYDVASGTVNAPGEVSISGEGYQVQGEGFQSNFNSQLVKLAKNVRCVFEATARLPDSNILPSPTKEPQSVLPLNGSAQLNNAQSNSSQEKSTISGAK